MKSSEELKAKHMAAANKRWDEAIEGYRRMLNYDRTTYYKGFEGTPETAAADATIRKLAKRFLTVSDSTRTSVFGSMEDGFGIKMNSYGCPDSVVGWLELLRFFVSHEILDDGSPAVGYYRSTVGEKPRTSEMFIRCGKNHPKAMPYFHRNIDVLREEGFGDAQWVCPEVALGVLEAHEARRVQMAANLQAMAAEHGPDAPFAHMWSEDKIAHYSTLSPEDQAFADLADELIRSDT